MKATVDALVKRGKYLQRSYRRIAIVFAFIFWALDTTSAQENRLIFVKIIADTSELHLIYDSLQVPLVLQNRAVYALHSECFQRNSGADVSVRNSGTERSSRTLAADDNERRIDGNSDDRAIGAAAEERNKAIATDARAIASNSGERSSEANTDVRTAENNVNARNSSSAVGARQQQADVDRRQAGSALGYLSCARDDKGRLIIYLNNMEPDKHLAMYCDGKYYESNTSFFKIKTK